MPAADSGSAWTTRVKPLSPYAQRRKQQQRPALGLRDGYIRQARKPLSLAFRYPTGETRDETSQEIPASCGQECLDDHTNDSNRAVSLRVGGSRHPASTCSRILAPLPDESSRYRQPEPTHASHNHRPPQSDTDRKPPPCAPLPPRHAIGTMRALPDLHPETYRSLP